MRRESRLPFRFRVEFYSKPLPTKKLGIRDLIIYMKNWLDFLPWFDEYSDLMVIGLTTNIGLFSHLVIAWFGGIGHRIRGLFYAAPEHDISALFAFLTILITTINFVASVEVNLYPKYRKYYDLFNGHGSILEIEQAEKEMLTVLGVEFYSKLCWE